MKKLLLFMCSVRIQLRKTLLLNKEEKRYYKEYLALNEQDSFQRIDPYLGQIQNKIYGQNKIWSKILNYSVSA